MVVLAPHPHWVALLPGGKLPDRGDFMAFGDNVQGRVQAWTRAWRESQRLADELAEAVQSDRMETLPL